VCVFGNWPLTSLYLKKLVVNYGLYNRKPKNSTITLMETKFPAEIKKLFDKFQGAGYQLFLVGGSVRDLLMSRTVHDWDFTTDAKPEEILKLYPDGFYNNKFGTVGIKSDSLGVIEVTTMRHEGNYKDHRHPVEVSWTNKVEEDLARRDFTINALAMDSSGKITDPFSGQEDLKEGIVKAVGDPDKRFKEDALRLIRAVRIANQLNFIIEENTLESITKNSQLIKEIASERVRDELFKILAGPDPYQGVITLREVGLLKIILPELEATFGIVQEGPKHDRIYDIGEHSLLSLKSTPSTDPLVRLAVLLHDIGKVETFKTDKEGNVTFYNHDLVGGKLVREIASRFNLSKIQSEKLYRLVRWHMFSTDEHQTDSAIRRFIKNVGPENIVDMFALRVGDRLGGGTPNATSWRMEKFQQRIEEVSKKPFSITDLKINGQDIMAELKMEPGRKVGEILKTLFAEVLEDSSKNNKDYLLKRAQEIN
jgi:tRNA nucleotidyltransferase (CCA-adding enzyme)